MPVQSPEKAFSNAVYSLVAQIPKGKVMTYGQIAALCGKPRAARIVGQVAHFGPEDLPWQRVVKKDGGLAEGFPGGEHGHAQVLSAEGVVIEDLQIVDIQSYLYWPTAHE